MNHLFAIRKTAEARLIEELQATDRWLRATEIAAQVGWPWRVVARALQRLAEQGAIESKTSEWKSQRSRTRKTTIYHLRKTARLGVFPSWLEPTIPTVVGGRLVVQLSDDDLAAKQATQIDQNP